ncbi:MAG: patatin-like phospholipase family protein, partial [Candidatus Thiodiazotropha sp.]
MRQSKLRFHCLFMVVNAFLTGTATSDSMPERVVPELKRPSIGLVLSGGGARGAAHVGVLKVLEEMRIPIDYVAGTSMGAIVGGLYASGMTAEALEQVVSEADWGELLSDRPPRAQRSLRRKSDEMGFLVDFDVGLDESGLIFPGGLVQGQNLEIELKRLTLPVIRIDDFDNLPVPFRAIATDIVSGDEVVLGSGDLATAMRASMSV